MDPFQREHAREIDSHHVLDEDPATAQRVFALEAPYTYAITAPDGAEISLVQFQRGKPQDGCFNGVQLAALIAIEIDVLKTHQLGEFHCPENFRALYHLEEALFQLKQRQADRIRRHVAGEQQR